MKKLRTPVQVKAQVAIKALDELTTAIDRIGDIGERNLEREMYLLYVKTLKVRKLLADTERN